ncbi:unnamed protein product, partial [Brachionus calyciflorus]
TPVPVPQRVPVPTPVPVPQPVPMPVAQPCNPCGVASFNIPYSALAAPFADHSLATTQLDTTSYAPSFGAF